jgi:hypothetical protein
VSNRLNATDEPIPPAPPKITTFISKPPLR